MLYIHCGTTVSVADSGHLLPGYLYTERLRNVHSRRYRAFEQDHAVKTPGSNNPHPVITILP